MPVRIRRPRQAVGLIYVLLYLSIFVTYAFVRNDGQSWTIGSPFTVTVMLWFLLSLSVKVSMVINRAIELLNLFALLSFLLIGYFYNPHPALMGQGFSAIENFCYYLQLMGGSACDLFDFVYESAARRPQDTA